MKLSTRKVSQEVKTTVRRRIKNINHWRRLGVPWKAILKQLDLPCNEKTLSYHWRFRGIV